MKAATLIACALIGHSAAAQTTQHPAVARDTAARTLDTVVVHAGRLAIGGIPLGRAPFAAEVRSVAGSPRPGAASVADLTETMVGVSTEDQFGSPFQPDLRFRGFQVGPVVGYPQGMSVFVDGVRVNEPDASQVNFDLIPMQAIERVEVIRGPGGPFGRNTLAGSINFVTRSGGTGETHGSVSASGASFGTGELLGWAAGGESTPWLLSGRYNRTDGWRDLSESRVRQLFGKAGHHFERTDVWASYTFADDHIEGPGSLPKSWLRGDLPPELAGSDHPRRLQYTGGKGDIFEPRMHFGVVNVTHRLNPDVTLTMNGFVRSNTITQLNDNITEANVRGETDILSEGGTVQLARAWPSGATLSGGVEYARNHVGIEIFAEPNPAFPGAGGLTEQVETNEDNLAAFAQLWLPSGTRVNWLAALRYDYVRLPITDLLDPENSGTNTFNELTGSLGADVRLSHRASAFASYGRGFRAPVILEVSCADPEDPCPLPFELGADPPLDPVTTDTWQVGVRLQAPGNARVELIGYWTEVHNDLFNVIAPPSTRGYFRNLDRTRRQGIELSVVTQPIGALTLRGNLALTRATFQSDATLASALLADDDDEVGGDAGGNLAAQESPGDESDGGVHVRPGDSFAMTPAVTLAAGATYTRGEWSLALGGNYVGSQFFVGDEDNDEEFGKLDAQLMFSGQVTRAIGRARLFARGENLLGSSHETFGLISPNVRGPDDDPQPFVTPGLPFRVVAGIGYDF